MERRTTTIVLPAAVVTAAVVTPDPVPGADRFRLGTLIDTFA
jgi:hypothetical protein